MIIRRIKISNYKTYLSLDLDLTVHPDQPIILIGGMNGDGKTLCLKLYVAHCMDKKNKGQGPLHGVA